MSSRHRNGRSARSEVNRRRWRSVEIAAPATVTQLSIAVIPPTLQVAVVKNHASMRISSGHFVVSISKGRGTRRTGIVLEGNVVHEIANRQVSTLYARRELVVC